MQIGSSPQTTAEQVQQLLNQAQASSYPQRERMQLQASRLLIEEQQLELAEQILANLQPDILSIELLAHYSTLSSELQIRRGQYEKARLILEAPRLMAALDSLSIQRQLKLNLLRAEVFALLGSHIASAQQRIYIDPLLDSDNQRSNREAIWDSLMYVAMDELNHYKSNTFGGEYQGWLELAIIAKENQGDLEQQVKQLEGWQQQWQTHPANESLPGGLRLIRELAENRPRQVSLLLPLTGKLAPFGKAVRDGFIAARYQNQQRGGKVPQLKIYDTNRSDDFLALYQQAVSEGAELIVGPLEKHRLSLLFDAGKLPVTTLALNRVENYGQAPSQLFQFGLAPSDEAQQVADIAYLDNHRQAMIIAPRGEWGDKVNAAFADRWQQLGGNINNYSLYSGQQDYSSAVKEGLLLQESEDRAKRIKLLIGESVEFLPRRRQDIDMIFMLARPQQARSLKPLLAYHYAGELPVYGTSRLYAGFPDSKKDRDINGVRFTDMPWVLNKATPLHQQINNEIEQSKQYQRMYALGIDSYQLHPRLRQLLEMTNSRVYGHTGSLKLNANREIERRMLLAQISAGKAKVIPTASLSSNLDLPTKEGEFNDFEMEQSVKKQRDQPQLQAQP
ncbi:MAG: outer membrane PBP1 activator LpoA protein [Oceanicoccus sp.]